MRIEPPKIDERRFSDLLNILKEMVPHYTPEWRASDDKDAGVALLKIFSHIAETVIHRFNQVPHKNLVAFLDMMGIKLLPAQPSRVPLTFKLAKGTDKEILIPAKTQAAADKTEEHEELPFETEKNLLAIPSQLKKLISVDPQQDAIYLPPPDFLNNGELSKVQLIYKIVSSPSAGATNFQLDHVTDLKEGDFLKISQEERVKNEIMSCSPLCNFNNKPSDGGNSEYVIISGISGNIVSITDGLSRPYSAGANVEKVTRFNLLEGKNFQEHSLYMGHTDLFNMESTGKITVEIILAPGTEVGNSSLDLIWEYWGEDKEKEKDAWLSLQVEDDETNGFKQSGNITLLKTKEGKIKEEKLEDIFKKTSRVEITDASIKEIKTRWIRCRLKDALAEISPIKLPLIDTIFVRTEPSVPVKADKAFYQDVPLGLEKAAVIRNMLPLDIQLSLYSSISQGAIVATLNETPEGALRDGDLLEFDNGIDPPERRVISIQPPISSVTVTWEGGLLYNYPTTAKVSILTAIRAGEQTPTVILESVENLTQGDRITLIGTESITAIIKSLDSTKNNVTLELDQPVKNAYIKGDIVLKGEGIPNFPFGKHPRLYDTFSIASQEAFSKKKAFIEIFLDLGHQDTTTGLIPPPNPQLSWEYWNGKGWQVLTDIQDSTNRLMNSGKNSIRFRVPIDIAETEINGQKNYWIRVRIVGGDYGREEYILKSFAPSTTDKARVQETMTRVERKFKLPIIRDLSISYSFDTKEELQYCLTYNNLNHQDKTSESKTQGLFFQPFMPLDDTNLSLYLGFDNPLKGGPIRIFFGAKELSFTEEKKPKLEWTYSGENEWKELSHLDATEGLIRADILELLGPSDLSAFSRFGNYLHWLKGSLTEGEYDESPVLDGIYPNTTWAIQAETIKDEILGSSDGEAEQTFSFLKFPVLEGEEIRIREVLSEEEKQNLIESLGEDAIYEVKDEKGEVTETWVLWKEVYDFFDSKENSRHYMLDRAIGKLQFGDGINGMIPPAGDNNIKAFSYQAGGGAQGNVKTGEIKTLKSAVGGVDKASNPAAADGGANTATLDEMLEIGPAMISHRNRAVTVEDFEWLAKQAARKVVKVRCLPNINNNGQTEIGWVTVVMVPDSKEDKPLPSLELKRKVRRYLDALCANTLVSAQHIYTKGPSYTEIGVSADVFVVSIDVASETEREVRSKLKAFFHPLTGGPEEKGWDFGRDVSASDIYALLEDIEGVDHVENVRFKYNGTAGEDIVEIKQDFLVANGTHEINIQLTNGGS